MAKMTFDCHYFPVLVSQWPYNLPWNVTTVNSDIWMVTSQFAFSGWAASWIGLRQCKECRISLYLFFNNLEFISTALLSPCLLSHSICFAVCQFTLFRAHLRCLSLFVVDNNDLFLVVTIHSHVFMCVVQLSRLLIVQVDYDSGWCHAFLLVTVFLYVNPAFCFVQVRIVPPHFPLRKLHCSHSLLSH